MPRLAQRTAVDLTPSITTFGRVSKTNTLNTTPIKKSAVTIDTAPSKKRKASTEEESKVAVETTTRSKRACRRTVEPTVTAADVKKVEEKKIEAKSEKSTKGKRVAKPAARNTHKPSCETIISSSRASSRKVQTKLDATFKKIPKDKQDGDDYPPHLSDLIAINRAFVKTTLLHMIHAGSAVPVDTRTLTPSITSAFGKRAVVIEDLRRCIAIQSGSEKNPSEKKSPFVITDYGRGKVCVELVKGVDISGIKAETLCQQFVKNLRALAEEKSEDAMDVDIPLDALSLDGLPQVDITNRAVSLSANPMLKKGHQALTSLQQTVAAQKAEKEAKVTAAPLLHADGKPMSLLDRIRHKQLTNATSSPTTLTGPEAARRAALNRVPDVAATLAMLCLSKPASLPRQAFTMGVVLEKLRDSLRTPMARDEMMAAVRIIAGEVAPEWVRVLVIGGRENVVLSKGGQPGEKVIQARVEKLLG